MRVKKFDNSLINFKKLTHRLLSKHTFGGDIRIYEIFK